MIPFIRLNPKTLALTYTGKRYGNRGVFPCLYICLIADSKIGKSHVLKYNFE